MDDRELGSDGEDILSGASSVEDEANENQLEFDMWEGQFSLASALPAARHAPWFSTSELNSRPTTFDSYLAGNLKNGTTLLSPVNGTDLPSPPPARMTRSLQHMPSYMTETLEEKIQSEVDDILNEMDASYEDAVEILTRNRVNSFSNRTPRCRDHIIIFLRR
jgi:hypothetical protein